MEEVTTPESAKLKQLQLSPKLLQEIADDPELLATLSRSQLAMVNSVMVNRLLSNPDATVANFANVSEQLLKTAKITNSGDAGAGSGFSINIVLGNKPDARTEKVINAQID